MKKIWVAVLIFSLCFLFWGHAFAQQKQVFVSIGTATMGGTSYIVGAGFAKLFSKHLPWVTANATPTRGSIENINLINRGEMTMDISTPADTAYYAFKGIVQFKEPIAVRAMTWKSDIDVYPIVLADSPIKRFQDMKGKRISLGPPGSSLGSMAQAILEANGLQFKKDYEAKWLGNVETVNAFKDNTIDAGFFLSGFPSSAVIDLALTHPIRMLPVTTEMIQKITAKHPYYYRGTIKGGVFKGINEDTACLSLGSMLLVHQKADLQLIYSLTKVSYEHLDEVKAIHSSMEFFDLKNATRGINIPFHPGAEKYFKEVGLIK